MKNENPVKKIINKIIRLYIFFGLLVAIILISSFRLRAELKEIKNFELSIEKDIVKILKDYKQINEYIYYAPVSTIENQNKYFCVEYKKNKFGFEIAIVGIKTKLSKEELENKRILLIRILNLKLKENNSIYKLESCIASRNKNMFDCYFELKDKY